MIPKLSPEKELDKIKALPIVGAQPESEKEEKFLREICEFEFQNLEEPGLMNKFPYGGTKKSHVFNLFHGQKYTLPRFIARHVESCATPLWDWRPNGMGQMEKRYLGSKPRFQMRQTFKG